MLHDRYRTHLIRVAGALVLAVTTVAAAPVTGGDRPWLDAGPMRPIASEDGTTDPAVRGVWRSRGYGWVLDISETGAIRYQEGDACYRPAGTGGPQSEMDSTRYRWFRMLPDGDTAIFQLLEGDTNVVFDRIEALPAGCASPADTSPQAVAAAFLDHFERHYAFFDRRPPGFAGRAARLEGTIRPGMTDAQLWEALASFMDGLSDSHTKLIGTVGGERRRIQDGQGKILPRIRESEGGESAWLSALIAQTKERLGPTSKVDGNGRIVWGTIDDRIGYLQLFVMGGFTDREDFASSGWARAEHAELDRILDEALASFAGLDAVILDLSNNRGGWDRVAKLLPARFTSEPFIAFTTHAQNSGQAPFPHEIEPVEGPRFAGPVYLMTSDVTVSGGELATLAFRQLPQVVQVGMPTRGAFSTPLPKPLPNGWLLELSNETFAAPDGAVYEERGISPVVPLDIYPPDDPVGGHWKAVEYVAEMAKRRAD